MGTSPDQRAASRRSTRRWYFALLRQLTGATWRSLLVAALFAVHPLHVESVAWVSERKDVLSAFFGLLALIFYTRYARSQQVAKPEAKIAPQSAPSLSRLLSTARSCSS